MSLTVKIKFFQVTKLKADKIAKIEFRGVSHFSRVLEGSGELIIIDEMIEENIGGKSPTENLILEYEDTINTLEIQLQISQNEQKNLKDEIFHLIAENQNLSGKLDSEYRERINETVSGDFSENFKSELVINLQTQLNLCKREKEKTLELYKTSLKLIEKLEEELTTQQENFLEKTQSKVSIKSPSVSLLESKLKNAKDHLEIALEEREKLENENVKFQTEIAKLKMNVESNNKVIQHFKKKEEEWKEKYNKMEQEYTLLNATFECVVKSRNELEKKLERYSATMQQLEEKNNESKNKVGEALDIIEKAIVEKDSALLREQHLKEEIGKLQLCLEHVVNEAGKKVGMGVEEMKKKFETSIKELITELSDVKNELEKKKLECKRITFKYKKLEKLANEKLDKEKINIIKGSETEITILENHLDSVYQELEKLKIRFDDLGKEKKNLEEELEGFVRKYENLIKDKESRESFWSKITEELKTQIDHKLQDLNEACRRSEFFLNQVKNLQQENLNLKKTVGSCECEKLKEKIKKLCEMKKSQKIELESHVEAQMKVNEEWRKEVKEITRNFEERLESIKKECIEVKAKNKILVFELNLAKKKILILENT